MSFVVKNLLTVEGTQKTHQMKLGEMYARNIMSVAGGSFNGITTGATSSSTFHQRWFYQAFVATDDANNCCCFPFELPSEYVAGRDIKVEVFYTYSSTTGGNLRLGIGIQRVGGTAAFLNDSGVVMYNEATVPAPIGTTHFVQKHSHTFSGTGFNPGDIVNIIFYRNTTAGNADTLTSTLLVSMRAIYSV